MTLALIALIAIPMNARIRTKMCVDDKEDIDPDVGGIGILLGLFVPCLVLLGMPFVGHFKAEISGVKELCMAQCASTSLGRVPLMAN
jgi:hypothetical protein